MNSDWHYPEIHGRNNDSRKFSMHPAIRLFDFFARLFLKFGGASMLVVVVLLSCLQPAFADEVRVAVAANFAAPIQKIAPDFERTTGHRIVPSFGSTGKFYAQINNGAPFEVLLAADHATPFRLEREGAAVAGSRFTYAIGKLALWSARSGTVDDNGAVLMSGDFEHIALANPTLAPYGAAAKETMQALDIYDRLKGKVVLGENIAQAHQFVASGNAELGFVSLSQIVRNGKLSGGSVWIVPSGLYLPIKQDAVVLNPGKGKPGVEALMHYLRSERAREVIKSFGYDL